jgi:lipopolysaccharide export system permease protein
MRLLDRYIIKSFLVNYLLAFGVLVGMYVLGDLIINIERFTKVSAQVDFRGMKLLWFILHDMLDFYSYQMLVIFQQVCVAIPLLAAGFTMVRMTRSNELTAILASGVSLYRVAAPIVVCAIFFSLLVIVDQELLMPACKDKLMRRHEDVGSLVNQSSEDPVYFLKDSDNSLLLASSYDKATQTLKDLRIVQRDPDGRPIGRILAATAVWAPDYQTAPSAPRGAWAMKDAVRIDDQPGNDPNIKAAEHVEDLAYNTGLTPRQLELVFQKKSAEYLSSAQIHELIVNSPALTRPELEKIMHIRFTQPVMNVILLLIGIPFLLTRTPGRLMVNMLYCGVVTTVCFVATFVIFSMAGTVLPVLLGAWLPVLIFAPMSLAMLDTIKT